jgi:hypothetical protein
LIAKGNEMSLHNAPQAAGFPEKEVSGSAKRMPAKSSADTISPSMQESIAGIQTKSNLGFEPKPHGKDEWLIDDSTRKLYLALLKDQECKGHLGQVRPAPRRKNLPKAQPSPARDAGELPQNTIAMDDGVESTSRFVIYAALMIGLSFLLYKAIPWIAGTSNTTSGHSLKASSRSAKASNPESGLVTQPAVPATPGPFTAAEGVESSLNLIPALVLDSTQPNQSSSHTLTVHNRTPFEMVFDIEAKDLVSKSGKPVYLPPGQVEGSVAGTIVYSTRSLQVKPMQSASLDVTLTMPSQTEVRGVAIILNSRGSMPQGERGSLAASLASIITWVSAPGTGDSKGQVTASALLPGTNLAISQWFMPPSTSCPSPEATSDGQAGAAVQAASGGLQ